MRNISLKNRIDWYKAVSLIAVLCLPLVYGFLYLWAFWDPYSMIKYLPVAVVNEDSGGIKDGENYVLGDRLVEKLKGNPALEWHFVSKTEAERGLNEKNYYAMVIIPTNFSDNVLSAQGDQPKAANLILKVREANSYMATKFADTATFKLVTELNKEVEEEYWKNVFVNLRETANKLGNARDGTGKLYDGLSDIAEGNSKITDGLKTAKTGSNDLNSGLNNLLDGSNTLMDGIKEAKLGGETLSSGLTTINGGLTTLGTNMATTKTSANQIQVGVAANKAGVDQALALLNADVSNIDVVKAILANVSTGLATVNRGAVQLVDGLGQIEGGITQLTAGSSTALTGSNNLVGGLAKLYDGETSLRDGLSSARDGGNELNSGLKDLVDGSNDLGEGITNAKDGVRKLENKLAEGQEQIEQKSSIERENLQIPMLSAPVSYISQPMAAVPNNGTGFAPYFIPLSLWVGAMAIYFVIEKPRFCLKMMVRFGLIGTGQAILLTYLLMKILGLEVTNIYYFFGFTIILSWTTIAIQSLMNHLLSDAGKFVNILLLMLQLTSSAGSYPLETTPSFFQKIHRYLPMTYAVTALREIISGGNGIVIGQQTIIIGVTGVTFLLLNSFRKIVITNYVENGKKNKGRNKR